MTVAILGRGAAEAALPDGVGELAEVGPARIVGDMCTPTFVAGSGRVAIVGWAFRSSSSAACTALSTIEVDAIIADRGGWAIDNLWGDYLLVWHDSCRRIFVLRSPVTGPPLFLGAAALSPSLQGSLGFWAFTDLAFARALGLERRRLDPAAIDAELRFPMLRARATGIAGVREILAGERAELGVGEIETVWSPSAFVACPPRRICPNLLREKVSRVVTAWSDRFERVQLELSGGLDSSIVAACLAGRRTPWRAVTLATIEPDGDERRYARAVADRTGVGLAEICLSAEPPNPIQSTRLRVRAGGFGLLGAADAALLAAAREFGANAIFSGAGGDNIFGFLTSPGPVVDALRFGGAREGWRAARDLARVTGDDLWTVWRFVLRRIVGKGRLWPVETRFLSSHFADNEPMHPWFADLADLTPGQRAYALKILLIQPFLAGYDRALAMPMIAPLLAQPIVEFGLGVPSWQWSEGGQDRALARRAFRHDLPDEILARRTKGRIVSMFFPAFDACREQLHAFLLDGLLASHAIIDRAAIDDFIAGRVAPDPVAIIRLLHIADMECWARAVAA